MSACIQPGGLLLSGRSSGWNSSILWKKSYFTGKPLSRWLHNIKRYLHNHCLHEVIPTAKHNKSIDPCTEPLDVRWPRRALVIIHNCINTGENGDDGQQDRWTDTRALLYTLCYRSKKTVSVYEATWYVLKLLDCYYDFNALHFNPISTTRENILNCRNSRHYNIRKYSICSQVTTIWNSLPDYVIEAVSTFKGQLDKH